MTDSRSSSSSTDCSLLRGGDGAESDPLDGRALSVVLTGSPRTTAQRAYYSSTLSEFCSADCDAIFGRMARQNDFDLTVSQPLGAYPIARAAPLFEERLRGSANTRPARYGCSGAAGQ